MSVGSQLRWSWPTMDQNNWAVEPTVQHGPTKKQPLEWANVVTFCIFLRLLKWCSKTFWQNHALTALLHMCCLGFSLILGNWHVGLRSQICDTVIPSQSAAPKRKHGWSLGHWRESKTAIIFNQMPWESLSYLPSSVPRSNAGLLPTTPRPK